MFYTPLAVKYWKYESTVAYCERNRFVWAMKPNADKERGIQMHIHFEMCWLVVCSRSVGDKAIRTMCEAEVGAKDISLRTWTFWLFFSVLVIFYYCFNNITLFLWMSVCLNVKVSLHFFQWSIHLVITCLLFFRHLERNFSSITDCCCRCCCCVWEWGMGMTMIIMMNMTLIADFVSFILVASFAFGIWLAAQVDEEYAYGFIYSAHFHIEIAWRSVIGCTAKTTKQCKDAWRGWR